MIKDNFLIYIWSAIDRFGTQIILFIGNILIARILGPDDYGLIAMLSIFMAIAFNLTDSGFSDCLIQKKEADKLDFGTVMIFNLFVAFSLYIIIYIIAPYIADYFDRNELIQIARIFGLSILLNGFTLTAFTQLRKELKFKMLAKIGLIGNVLMIVVAYVMAYLGFGYWALVFQSLTLGILKIVLLLILGKWRPYFNFSFKRYKDMSSYSYNLLASYLFNQISKNLYSVIIGKFQTAASLGFYRQADKIKELPIMGLNAVVLNTSYPILAVEVDKVKRYNMYVSLFNNFLFLHFITVTLLFGMAFPLISLLYGQKWEPIIPYFQLMLIASLFVPVVTMNNNIAKVLGNAKMYRNLGFIRAFLSIMALLILRKNSIEVIIFGQIGARYISVFIDAVTCGNLIDLGIIKQFKIVLKQIWIPLISLFVAYFFSSFVSSNLTKLIIYALIYVILFVGLCKLTNKTEFKKLQTKVLSLFK